MQAIVQNERAKKSILLFNEGSQIKQDPISSDLEYIDLFFFFSFCF